MATQTAYVNTVDTGLWEAAACSDIELIMMMPSDSKKRQDVASCVDESPFNPLHLLPESIRKYSEMIVYLSLYMVAGPALIMCNKVLVKDIGFKFPMTLSLWSQFMGTVIIWITVHGTGQKLPNKDKATWRFFFLQIMPIGALMAAKMMLGMKSYIYLTVSFIQMFKAFTPAITLFVLFVSGVSTPSRNVSLSVLAMCAGMCITAAGEVNFSVIGVTLIFAAQISEATRLVLMQRFIKKLGFKAVELQYYRAPACALVLFFAAAFMEFEQIYETGAIHRMFENIHLFLLQSFLGFAVNMVNTMVIKITDSVTLKVLAVVRNACLVSGYVQASEHFV
uniref:Sugar phosphate transporter domain-containing protein n=1 Tax=Lotharella globosa TaxID=91324 RepID=A0A6V3K5Z7_9EUKA